MPNQIVGQNQEMLEFWMYTPDDILMHIFQFLPATSLLKVAQVWKCTCSLLYFPLICLYYTNNNNISVLFADVLRPIIALH